MDLTQNSVSARVVSARHVPSPPPPPALHKFPKILPLELVSRQGLGPPRASAPFPRPVPDLHVNGTRLT